MNHDRRLEEHVDVSALRQFSARRLRALDHPIIIHDAARPVRVLVPYATFMLWQQQIASVGGDRV